MIDGEQHLRVAGSVTDRTMLLLQGVSAFFAVASAVEVAWMDSLGGTGTPTPVSGIGAGAMLLFLAVMLMRFREAKLAVPYRVTGPLSEPPAGGAL